MKHVLRFALCCSLAAGVGMAQRRGGGGSTGGSRGGGGISRGGGFASSGFRGSGGFASGGFRGGVGGFRGNFGGNVFRGGFGFNRFSGFRGSPFFGFGLGYGYYPWYGDYDYGYSPYPAYGYPSYGAGYDSSPNMTVVYAPPASAPAPVYMDRGNSGGREYDQYGQETNRPTSGTGYASPSTGSAGSASPVYLIAFRDHTIFAAMAYWAEGGTLHYVTLEHEQKQAPLNTVDRDLSGQLNRERRVAFSLPAAQ
jgi:hypothetical protein